MHVMNLLSIPSITCTCTIPYEESPVPTLSASVHQVWHLKPISISMKGHMIGHMTTCTIP